jgi:cytochrome P450
MSLLMTEITVEPPLDPYEGYRQLRQKAPVSKMDDGVWQVASHESVQAVLRDPRTFSSDVALRPPEEKSTPSMLFSDAPIHNRLRKLVSHAFKPSHIESQRELIAERCEELMLQLKTHQQADLVEAMAAPLPVTVIAHMLGVADGDIREFKSWSDAIFSNIADILFGTASPEAVKAGEKMDAYFLAQIEQLRLAPKSHLLGRLVETETEDGQLSDEELLSFCRLLLIAGNETTTGLITGSVRILDEFPQTLQQLKSNPALIPTFVEEALRFYSPFSATARRTTCDTELGGVLIPAGDLVIPLMASANRDEKVFQNPDEFVIDRNPNPHLAFGFGIHFCLGAHLARLEGEIFLQSVIKHLETISLVEEDHSQMSDLGGPSKLMINLKALKE